MFPYNELFIFISRAIYRNPQLEELDDEAVFQWISNDGGAAEGTGKTGMGQEIFTVIIAER